MEWSQLCMDHSICLRICRSWLIDWLFISNVQTVKEHTFYKRSTNAPQTFWHLTGIKPKRLSSFPNMPHRKRSFLQESRFLSKSKQSVLNKTNSATIPKRFRFVSKTTSESLSFRFWHYYVTYHYGLMDYCYRMLHPVLKLCWEFKKMSIQGRYLWHGEPVIMFWRSWRSIAILLIGVECCREENNKSLHFTYFSVTY